MWDQEAEEADADFKKNQERYAKRAEVARKREAEQYGTTGKDFLPLKQA